MHNELLDAIVENRFKDKTLQVELCDQLLQIGKQKKNNFLIGAAYAYKAEAYISSSINKAESNAILSLQYLNEDVDAALLSHVYNMLGVINADKDDTAASLDYFIKCKDVCDAHNLEHEKGLVLANIGMNFQILDAYEKAIPYYEESIDHILSPANSEIDYDTLIGIHANLFVCYYNVNNAEEAKISLDLILSQPEFISNPLLISLFEALYYSLINETDQMNQKIDETLTICYTVDNVLSCIDEFIIFCDFLYKLNRLSYLVKLLDWIDSKLKPTDMPRARMKFLKYRLKCIVEQQDYNEYVKWSNEYIHTFEAINDSYHQSIVDSAELRLYISQLEKTEAENKKHEMIDELTQMNNRTGFRYYSEAMIKKSLKESIPVAYFFIDLDYFKEIESFHGQDYAQQCLLSVADILQQLQNEATVIGRYDIDEFVILMYGKSYDEVEQTAKSIKEYVDSLCLKIKISPVADHLTLSQGIFYGVPKYFENLADCMRKADVEMHNVKNNGRNGYRISTGGV